MGAAAGPPQGVRAAAGAAPAGGPGAAGPGARAGLPRRAVGRRRPGSGALREHPAAGLPAPLGGGPEGQPLRADLRHHRLLGDPLGAQPLRHRRAGPLLPPHVPLPAAGQPAGPRPPAAAREVPRRRRPVLRPPPGPPAGGGAGRAALLQAVAGRRLSVRPRHADRAQLRHLPAAADRRRRRRRRRHALRVLRPGDRRADAAVDRQGDARHRRDPHPADRPRLPGAARSTASSPR